ncbi:Bro-N domain-containing protein, partial [Pasteurella multocida]
MTTQIQFNAFNFKSSQVRVITDPNQEFWFCGSDVCYILGYKNAPDALAKHCKQGGIAKRYTSTQSGEQEMIFINEPNLYRLIIKSRKPEAEPFETWVFEEVLPQIRKMGKYEVQPQQLTLPEPKPRGILLDEEAFYVVAKAIAKLNESTFEWEKMMDLFS